MSAPSSALLLFTCPHCEKEISVQLQQAGNRIVCPQCHQRVEAPSLESQSWPWLDVIVPSLLAGIVLGTFALKLRNLEHTALNHWDEAFHAIVARNVQKHPLKPTLVDAPYLPFDGTKWGENHVWLHKPILPFWQVALSFAILGVHTFALRLPAVILSTAAVLVTYFIGKELFNRGVGLIAAIMQAINPFLITLVHGYQFADHIDVALLFWVEVGMYFLVRSLQSGSWPELLLAGLAQGLAFLCKSYLACIVTGVALAAWLLPFLHLVRRDDLRMSPGRLLTLIGISAATAVPWLLYCMVRHPAEFAHEHLQVWQHLYANVETWAAPWDRLVFDYLIAIYGVWYTPILVALVTLVAPAVQRRHAGLWIMYAWGAGVIVPHILAVSKTPSATLLAAPAMFLLLAFFIVEAWRGQRWLLVALAAILAMSVFMPARLWPPGHGFPSGRAFAGVMRQSLWVVWHVAGACGLALVAGFACWLIGRSWPTGSRILRWLAASFTLLVIAWLAWRTISAAWDVTSRNCNDRLAVEIGRFARDHLPANAVLLCESRTGYDHLSLMFYADRTCYMFGGTELDDMARRVIAAGGQPYVISSRTRNLPVVRRHVYRWAP